MRSVGSTELLGSWTTDPQDTESLRTYGRVSLEFDEDGNLQYTIHGEGKDQIMLLSYRVQNGVLTTNQPSEPREERTPFMLTLDGKLLLQYEGAQSRYIRSDEVMPWAEGG